MSIDGLRTWTWGAHTFARIVNGSDVQPWFKQTALVAVEPILGSNTRYVDVGGTTWEALTVRAVFADQAARDACLADLGTVQTLTNIRGQFAQAVLVAATPANMGSGMVAADLQWERL